MTPKSKTSVAVVDRASNNGSNPERERVFNAYRHWGYLEADLDPHRHTLSSRMRVSSVLSSELTLMLTSMLTKASAGPR